MIKRFRLWIAAKIAGDIGPCIVGHEHSHIQLANITFPGHGPFRTQRVVVAGHHSTMKIQSSMIKGAR